MATTTTLKVNQKVHALIDLPRVPRGTRGKVLLIGGVSWTRYWVDFDNGISMPSIDRAVVGSKDEWEKARHGPATTTAVATTGAAVIADAAPEGEPIEGVPFHLIERSRRARERLGAG